jgi:hypothetical protein
MTSRLTLLTFERWKIIIEPLGKRRVDPTIDEWIPQCHTNLFKVDVILGV